jgi:hypothetical protein
MSTPTKFCAAVCVIPSLLFPRRPILCSPLHPWPRYNPSIGSSLLLGSHLITFMCLTVSLARSHMAYFLGFLPLFLPDLILSLFLLQRLIQHFLPPTLPMFDLYALRLPSKVQVVIQLLEPQLAQIRSISPGRSDNLPLVANLVKTLQHTESPIILKGLSSVSYIMSRCLKHAQ